MSERRPHRSQPSAPSLAQWSALCQHLGDAVLIADADSRYLAANPAACALLGHDLDELLTLSVPDVVAAATAWTAAEYGGFLAAGAWRGEVVLRRGDGRTVSVEAVATTVPAAGRTLHISVLRDISVRVATQAAADHAAAGELLNAQDLYESLFTGAPLPMVIADLDATVRKANPALCRLLGYCEHDLVGRSLGELTHPDDMAESLKLRSKLMAGMPDEHQLEKRYRHADGHYLRVVVSTSVLRDAHGNAGGFAAVLEDVTERRTVEQSLARERGFTALVFDAVDVGIAAFDNEGRLTVLNRFSRERSPLVSVGMTRPEWSRHFTFLRSDGITPLPADELPLNRALRGEQVQQFEMVMRTATGDRRDVLFSAHPLVDGVGVQTGAVVTSLDLTARRTAEASLLRSSRQDPLTGLGNRTLLVARMDALVVCGRTLTLVVLDLDDFQHVNDHLGHDAGDMVLVTLGNRLRSALRPGDTVVRLGGDEFAVLLPDVSPELGRTLAESARSALVAPIQVDGQEFRCDASVGLVSAVPGARPEHLLRDADLAMYAAKTRGKGNVAVFEPQMHQTLQDCLALDRALHDALDQGQLRLVYQPIVDVPSGALRGFEALCRWEHPDLGAVPPLLFIPRAEALGLITHLGIWVLRTAVHQVACWQAAYPGSAPLSMSVNLSPQQLSDPDLADTVAAVLRDAGLEPEQLTLEITESAVMGGGAGQVLDGLRAVGVRLAVDDFGTGFSSLGRLHSLPVQIVKIDKSFVDTIVDGEPAPIVTATIAMARALGLRTVAEGVESQVQFDFLRAHGCDSAQGYLLGRPAEVCAIDALLQAAPPLSLGG